MDYQKIIEKHKVGTVAVKQALSHFHGLSTTVIAVVSNVPRRVAHSHITAVKGSGVKDWNSRTEAEKWKAIEAGEEIVNILNEAKEIQ